MIGSVLVGGVTQEATIKKYFALISYILRRKNIIELYFYKKERVAILPVPIDDYRKRHCGGKLPITKREKSMIKERR